MAATYMHIGIPVLNKKPGMVYNDWGKFWVNESVDAYDYKIEYLKFEEGTRFPEILSKQPHVPIRWMMQIPIWRMPTGSSLDRKSWVKTFVWPLLSRMMPLSNCTKKSNRFIKCRLKRRHFFVPQYCYFLPDMIA